MLRRPYTDDHEMFRDSVREFLRREVRPFVGDHLTDREYPRTLWRAAGAQGFLGLEIPERHGGSAAGDYRYNAVLIEELATVTMALASSLSIHFDVVAPYLVDLTSTAQRDRWLPGVASGEVVLAIGMTEPSAGTDLAALRTTADPRGDAWVLNGAKTFITNGHSADLVLVAARTTPAPAAGASRCSPSNAAPPASPPGASSTRSASPRRTPPSCTLTRWSCRGTT
ncbi:acyl-CoA dehydrogenase family protein [Plantactinospora sp. KBS50]|uniref:acyl-CoA dehydrogenase family protein n=1 Tax=Plantactinospora sp. KBS50 TaxID=2024580 RepID=UPI001E282FAB|nr:acyl-CoA dehydrogenase family protein [Plantactinospora sp. KBS50]